MTASSRLQRRRAGFHYAGHAREAYSVRRIHGASVQLGVCSSVSKVDAERTASVRLQAKLIRLGLDAMLLRAEMRQLEAMRLVVRTGFDATVTTAGGELERL